MRGELLCLKLLLPLQLQGVGDAGKEIEGARTKGKGKIIPLYKFTLKIHTSFAEERKYVRLFRYRSPIQAVLLFD